MLYAMLAYHNEGHVKSWSDEEDAALMAELGDVHARLGRAKRLGPAARLGATAKAVTVGAKGVVTDGPFAETKEQLLGFYILDFESLDTAIEAAKAFQAANPSATYELRPIVFYRPGKDIPLSDFGLDDVRPERAAT
ncbi:MAG: YciI family protein [Phenylobacterium sp.]